MTRFRYGLARHESQPVPEFPLTWGQAAALIAALAFVALVAFLAMVLAKIGAILSEVQMTLNDVRKETMPLLKEVRTTVVTLNVEMDRVDGIMASAESAAASVSNVAKLVTSATANPIIKGMAFLTGAGASLRSLRRKRGNPDEE
jgi:uncharacterized protein YoxC